VAFATSVKGNDHYLEFHLGWTEMNSLEDRLAHAEALIREMRAELDALKSAGVGSTVTAPFRVVDGDGRPLMEVRTDGNNTGIYVFTKHGPVGASLGTDAAGGGFLTIRNLSGQMMAYLNVETSGARLILSDHEEQGGLVFYVEEEHGGGITILNRQGQTRRLHAHPQHIDGRTSDSLGSPSRRRRSRSYRY
jgi:hypothetical protein